MIGSVPFISHKFWPFGRGSITPRIGGRTDSTMVIHHLRPSWDDPPSRNKPTNPSEQWKKGPLVVCWVYVVDEILPSYIGIGLFHQPFFLDPVIKQPGFSWLAYHCAPPWPKCSKHNGVSRKLLEPPWPSCFWLVVVGCFQPLRILGMSFFGVKKNHLLFEAAGFLGVMNGG